MAGSEYLKTYTATRLELNKQLDEAEIKLEHLRTQLNVELTCWRYDGWQVEISLGHILVTGANNISYLEKVADIGAIKCGSSCQKTRVHQRAVCSQQSGTVLLVILMSIVVMPLGVVAWSTYMNTRKQRAYPLIRIAVINLAELYLQSCMAFFG